MSSRSSNRIKRAVAPGALATIVALTMVAPAFASKKDDDYKKAQEAVNRGDVITAAKLFCQVSDEDPNYKGKDGMTAQAQCTTYSNETKRMRNQDQKNLDTARQMIKDGKLDDAEALLKRIKIPDIADQAKDELATINTKRNEQKNAEAAAANAAASAERNFQGAIQAYNDNKFPMAKDMFSSVTGPHAGEARLYLDKIQNYQKAMAEGRRLAEAKDFKAAAASYQAAANIKSDGPGDPAGALAQVTQQMAATNSSKSSGSTSSAANTTISTTQSARGTEVKPAVKTSAPTVDVARLMREADAAKAKGNVGEAKGKYLAVLAAEPGNGEARSALEALKSAEGANPSQQSAGAEADVMLARAISEFYGGQFQDSDVHIKDYLSANGSKTGLAYFYQGASKVALYYLGGTQDRQLKEDARAAFLKAKQVANFHPPDQKLVSPRVLSAYDEARR